MKNWRFLSVAATALILCLLWLAAMTSGAYDLPRYNDIVQDVRGNAISGARIYVYNANTTTLATLYNTNSEAGASKANPVTSDAYGRFWFYAPIGTYDLKITRTGIIDYTLEDVTMTAGYPQVLAVGDTTDPVITVNSQSMSCNETTTHATLSIVTSSSERAKLVYRWRNTAAGTWSTPATTGEFELNTNLVIPTTVDCSTADTFRVNIAGLDSSGNQSAYVVVPPIYITTTNTSTLTLQSIITSAYVAADDYVYAAGGFSGYQDGVPVYCDIFTQWKQSYDGTWTPATGATSGWSGGLGSRTPMQYVNTGVAFTSAVDGDTFYVRVKGRLHSAQTDSTDFQAIGKYVVSSVVSSGVTGSAMDDSVLTINGSGFGANGPHVVIYDDFEAGTDGDRINLGTGWAKTGRWDLRGPQSIPYYTNDFALSGSLAMQANMGPPLTVGTQAQLTTLLPVGTTECFVSYWCYTPVGTLYGGEGSADHINWKVIWQEGAGYGQENDFYIPQVAGDTEADLYSHVGGNDQTWHNYNSWGSFAKGQWHRVSSWTKMGVSDGQFHGWYLGPTGLVQNVNDNNYRIGSRAALDADLMSVDLERVCINGMARPTANCYPTYDDVYVATGPYSRARVEIGNGASLSSSTKIAIQIPLTWSDNEITFQFNPGNFVAGEIANVFVTTANGNTSTPYGPITIGSAIVPETPPGDAITLTNLNSSYSCVGGALSLSVQATCSEDSVWVCRQWRVAGQTAWIPSYTLGDTTGCGPMQGTGDLTIDKITNSAETLTDCEQTTDEDYDVRIFAVYSYDLSRWSSTYVLPVVDMPSNIVIDAVTQATFAVKTSPDSLLVTTGLTCTPSGKLFTQVKRYASPDTGAWHPLRSGTDGWTAAIDIHPSQTRRIPIAAAVGTSWVTRAMVAGSLGDTTAWTYVDTFTVADVVTHRYVITQQLNADNVAPDPALYTLDRDTSITRRSWIGMAATADSLAPAYPLSVMSDRASTSPASMFGNSGVRIPLLLFATTNLPDFDGATVDSAILYLWANMGSDQTSVSPPDTLLFVGADKDTIFTWGQASSLSACRAYRHRLADPPVAWTDPDGAGAMTANPYSWVNAATISTIARGDQGFIGAKNITANTRYRVDLTPFYQSLATGGGAKGNAGIWMLRGRGSRSYSFYSSNHSTVAMRPALKIVYHK